MLNYDHWISYMISGMVSESFEHTADHLEGSSSNAGDELFRTISSVSATRHGEVHDFPVTSQRLPRDIPVIRVTWKFRESRRNGIWVIDVRARTTLKDTLNISYDRHFILLQLSQFNIRTVIFQ